MTIKKLILVLTLMLAAVTAQAGYQLDNADSELYFTSIKKDKIAESHTFKQLSGSITEAGAAEVIIDLSSVETYIEKRNGRMKSMLFEINIFPKATVSTNIDANKLKLIKAGDMKSMPVVLTIDLHGQTKQLETTLRVLGLSKGGLLVTTIKPILLNAFDFGLNVGIVKLMEAAKLPQIATAVPVTFSLVFTND